MATLNPGIILAGRQPQPLNALAQGTQLAAATGQVQDANTLRNLYQQQGPGIMQGDPQALNALAQVDPGAALGIQNTRAQMDERQEKLRLAREQAAFAVQQAAANMSAEEVAREQQQMQTALERAAALAQRGNVEMAARVLSEAAGQDVPADPEAIDTAILMLDGGLQALATVQKAFPDAKPSEADEEIARMTGIGIPYEVAVKIKEGVFREVRDPMTNEVMVIDLATQRPVFIVGQDGIVRGDQAQQPMSGQQAQTPAASTAAPPVVADPALPPPANAEAAFGLRGVGARAANAVTDALGAGEAFPGVAENQRFFSLYAEDMLVDLSQAYGRQPAQALMNRLIQLIPQSGTMQGAEAAQGQLRTLRDRFASDLVSAEEAMRRRMSSSDRATAAAKVDALRAAVRKTDAALARFGAGQQGGGSGTTSSGISWSIED